MKYKNLLSSLILILVLGLSACSSAGAPGGSNPEAQVKDIILATTTSTQDSGLLDALHPTFESQSGYVMKTVAVGTGQALKMGEECNADVLLVHAPAAEQELMDKGYGAERLLVMHNDFIFVGPASDPAAIKGMASAAEALKLLAEKGALFASRGDDSGTHKMEKNLWTAAGTIPAGDWYIETGQGMGATLKVASEKGAYTLTDRGTFLALREGLDLEPLVERDTVLLNVYHVITVNPEKCSKTNTAGADAYAAFLTSPETQETISTFGVDKFGQALLYPDADKTDADLGLP